MSALIVFVLAVVGLYLAVLLLLAEGTLGGPIRPALRGGWAMRHWAKSLTDEERAAYTAWWQAIDLEEAYTRLCEFTPERGRQWLYAIAMPLRRG